MKSKKIIAMIVAFATFMALATSSFAAVTTTTTYNEIADKVVVDVEVTEATPSSEVTYLVKSNGQIVYIDQKTASTEGKVDFDYKIAKDKIVGLATDVKFGTNGAAAITDTEALVLNNVTVQKDANVTAIVFYKDAACEELIGDAAVVGTEDVIYAKVTVAEGFEIDQVSGLVDGSGDVYKVQGTAISVTTKATKVDPGVQAPEDAQIDPVEKEMEIDGETVVVKEYTTVLKVVGTPTEVGVEYDGEKYPALNLDGATNFTDTNGLCAVRIIVGADVVVDGLEPYYLTAAE